MQRYVESFGRHGVAWVEPAGVGKPVVAFDGGCTAAPHISPAVLSALRTGGVVEVEPGVRRFGEFGPPQSSKTARCAEPQPLGPPPPPVAGRT